MLIISAYTPEHNNDLFIMSLSFVILKVIPTLMCLCVVIFIIYHYYLVIVDIIIIVSCGLDSAIL